MRSLSFGCSGEIGSWNFQLALPSWSLVTRENEGMAVAEISGIFRNAGNLGVGAIALPVRCSDRLT
jgi:hypothetical protein